VNLANELCKFTFSKFSVKSFLAKPLSDHLSNLTTHSQKLAPCNITVITTVLDVEEAQEEGDGAVVKRGPLLARRVTESCGCLQVTLASHPGICGEVQ